MAKTEEARAATAVAEPGAEESSELKRLLASNCKSDLAEQWGIEESAVEAILSRSIVQTRDDDPPPSRYEVMSAGVIANRYRLDPMTNEVYFFRSRDGRRIVPIVGVDGWAKIVSRQPGYLGCEFATIMDDAGKCVSIRCKMRKATEYGPAEVEVEEFLSECGRNVGPWKSHPRRMLRHKAFQQAARLLFAITGIYDEDEGEVVAGLREADPRGYVEDGNTIKPMGGKHGGHPDLRHAERIGHKQETLIYRTMDERGLNTDQLVEMLTAGDDPEYPEAATTLMREWPASLLPGIQKWLDAAKKSKPDTITAADPRYYAKKAVPLLAERHGEGRLTAEGDAEDCWSGILSRMEGDDDLSRAKAAWKCVESGEYAWPTGGAK
jgi:phage recombination protein Bet